MDIKRNVDFIINKKIIQICFSRYQIKLIFDDKILIEIGDSIKYIGKNGTVQRWSYVENRNVSINSLLEVLVKKDFVDDSENLKIEFVNGDIVIIEAAKENNESYVIYNQNDFQVIC